MSIEAMLWAFKQNPERSSEKLVLLELSNHAGTDNTAWPSLARICSQTNLNRKTVISSLDALIEKGLVSDTGERKGLSGQIKVYRLNCPHSSLNETVPETELLNETVPFFPANSTVFSGRQYRKRDTESVIESINESNSIKGSRLPGDWCLTQEYIDAALAVKAIDLDELHTVADGFKDYWIAIPGQKGVKLDWLATWRNWIRRAKTTAPLTVKRNDYVND